MRRTFLCIMGVPAAFLLLPFITMAQQAPAVATATRQLPFTEELRFARYLFDKEMYAEADYVLRQINDSVLTLSQKDSLYYWQGWIAYTTKNLGYAAGCLQRVSPAGAYAYKSHFFAAWCRAFLKDTAAAQQILADIHPVDSLTREIWSFQQAGISLLKRNYPQYNQHRKNFTYGYYAMETEEKRMDEYRDKLSSYKRKSPFLAGLYSAIIPGAGKIYAGKKKQGVGAFLPVAALTALTWEAYNRGGVKSARFIGFGSLFTLFYTANIWGSVVAVKVVQHERNTYYDNKILFDMHIPLRNLYN